MPRLAHPPTLGAVHVHRPGGLSYFIFAALALLHAVVFRWVISTIGEPYKQTLEQNERIQATSALLEGIDRRSLLSLQSGLTRVTELPTFNDTLFDEGKGLHRQLRQRLDALKAAVDANEATALDAALIAAVELHTDGRPFVDRHHLRTAAKKLRELDASATVLERVRAAIELSREIEEEAAERLEEDEKKVPSQYLPSFWATLSLMGCLLTLLLTHMSAHTWSISFRALMYYHPSSALELGSYVRVVPPPHRGAAEIIPLAYASDGSRFFVHQRQKFEVVAVGEEEGVPTSMTEAGSGRVHATVGLCRPLLCPTELPLGEYAAGAGLRGAAVEKAREKFGENSFEIPMPTWADLYKEQLASPIAVFQLGCSVLWMLDEYWKYTLFTLFMILTFEGTTAFSRLKNMQQLRGMSAKAFPLLAYRDGGWLQVYSTALLPGDLICLRRQPGAEPTTVPADVVLLRGGAVVNESTLTGESIPQLKDPLTVESKDAATTLDIKSAHRVHTLYSGTLLLQATSQAALVAEAADDADDDGAASRPLVNCAGVKSPPEDGCVCYVLATAFSSSQGELMRMIEFSTAKVTADKLETLGLLLLLLCFALTSAGYVLKKGLEEGKKTQYELVLKCVLILTSVVPPELPMQTALAVNTALMALMKAQVFCTEPYRVPYAGRLTHCLFDKTGTLTTDELITRGVVTAAAAAPAAVSASASAAASATALVAGPREMQPVGSATPELTCVVGGCHALLQVDGQLMGDPIELAAIQSFGWTYDAPTSTASAADPVPKLDAALKQAEATLAAAKRKAAAPSAGAVTQAGGAANPAAAAAAATAAAAMALEEAKAAKERGVARRAAALHRGMTIRIVHRHHFASSLGRMSVVAHIKNLKTADGRSEDAVLCLVKGSPEAVGKLLKDGGEAVGGKPEWYERTYTALAEQGLRVLALACKRCGGEGPASAEASAYAKKPRGWVESGLSFCGFLAFGCPVRKDSASVIRSLRESRHTTIMLTGDAPLTALHVAQQVGMTGPHTAPGKPSAPPLLLHDAGAAVDDVGARFSWRPALSADVALAPAPFALAGVAKLRTAGHDLLVTGATWTALAEAAEAASLDVWPLADAVTVFARMSPDGKERVVRALNKKLSKRGGGTLMCGDGGNDVGALKTADVGVSLLTGFGNANVDKEGKEGKEGKDKEGDGKAGGGPKASAEDELAQIAKGQDAKRNQMALKHQNELKAKRAEVGARQKQYLEEEVRKLVAEGEGPAMAQFKALGRVTQRLKVEMAEEQRALGQKYGGGLAGQASFLAAAMESEDDADGLAPPMVKLGDASIAAPFTSKLPSIRSCVDIVRQGHCTLVSTVQQQQILMLHCLISAYSLSALSLEGSRSSEPQLIASGMLLSVASIAFSFARPLDRLSPTLPLASIFHPALLLSVLGQLTVHAGCMMYALGLAKAAMSESELTAAVAFQRKQERLEEQGVELPEGQSTWSNHKPNLLNTVVFLVETAQQVSVMLVNYKGRPWMRGATENPALLYSLLGLVVGIVVAAWELIPYLNTTLGLVPLPTDEMRYTLLGLIGITLLGGLLWDRLMLALFAPQIFASQLKEAASLSLSDFWGPNSMKYVGGAAAAGAWLYFTEGNMILAIAAYTLYNKFVKKPEAAAAAAAGGVAAAPPGQAAGRR